ncbi:MAG: hypothetical protein HYZ85_03380 [Candidatus Omnitrophica bacterium]|nr:hypothetical protein [Candidatus Omnitrophota bacterium]
MRAFLSGLFILLILIALSSLIFFLYSNFILDYSLEDLQIAVQGTENDREQTSPLVHRVYQRHVS